MEITLNVHVSGLEGLAEALKALTRPIEYGEPASPAAVEAKPTAPTPAAPIVPVAAPGVTLEQICKAGADLLTASPGLMPQLTGLLQKYGAQSAQQLKPEQLGAFATELRGMGARI